MDYSYYMPVKVIFGENCVKKYDFSVWGRRCVIITGKSGAKISGLLSDLEKTLKNQCIDFFIYDEAEQNPTVDTCYEAGALAAEFKADFIIGAGGGSAMDAAKAAAVFAAEPSMEMMSLFNVSNIKKTLPFILIGTTAGTGSEVTPYSILTVDIDGKPMKKSIKTPIIYAKAALCDAKYSMSMPWELTANTALDAICHAVESLFSVKAGKFETLYAVEAVKTGWESLIKAHWHTVIEKREVEYEQREKLLYASILAGMAISGTGTCFPHAMGYKLTTMKNIHHGKACAVFLGDFVRKMQGADDKRTSLLQKAVNEESLETFINGLNSMAGALPVLTKEEANDFASSIKDSPALSNSVVPINFDEVLKIYNRFVR